MDPFCHARYVRDEFLEGGPTVDIYAVEDYRGIEIDRQTINRMLGCEENFWPQGRWRGADDRPVARSAQTSIL